MASVKFYLDTRSARKDGTFPLKLVVTHKKPFNISLGVYLLPEQWNANEKKDCRQCQLSSKLW
ncbi:MAG: Arm DNA-binding domain-containing protein [Dysgonomonas sp.]